MKKHPELGYHPEKDRFLFDENSTESEDKVFMTIDELCASNKNVKVSPVEQQPDKSKEMEKLIGDRLLELSRYISINSISKTLIIDKTSLDRDGYQVTTH